MALLNPRTRIVAERDPRQQRGHRVAAGSCGATLIASVVALVMSSPAVAFTSPCGTSGVYAISGATATCTYTTQGTEDTFSVPSGASSLDVTAVGATGGQSSDGGRGGIGAQVTNSALPASQSELWVDVGQVGSNGSCPGGNEFSVPGGPFDGGAGDSSFGGCAAGGGGGGSSAVLTAPRSTATLTGDPATDGRLLVAGAGGGGGGGGGLPAAAGNAGATSVTGGGAGGCSNGAAGDGGTGGVGPVDGTNGGGKGACSLGLNGAASSGGNAVYQGGGGGGGWFGGGGGSSAGAGGGGSSYGGAGPSADVSVSTALSSQQPEVVISWALATPSISSVSPASGPVSGGTPITITGTGFVPGASVVIGQGHGAGADAIPASDVDVVSSTEITATTGPSTGQAIPNRFYVFVTDGGGTSTGTSSDLFTYTRVVSHFVFASTSAPAAGQSFTVKVKAEDASGHVVTTYDGSPTWSDSTGSLSPSAPVAFVNGVATTTDAQIADAAKADRITITDPSAGVTSTSAAFNVTGPLTHFVFVTIGQRIRNQAFTVRIKAEDALGDVITSYAGSPTWSDASSTLTPSSPAGFVNGVSSTTDAQVGEAYHADTITVTDTSAGVSSTSSPFNVQN